MYFPILNHTFNLFMCRKNGQHCQVLWVLANEIFESIDAKCNVIKHQSFNLGTIKKYV